jgi:4-amino-4-deoxy-L-arabinose transferase-like glycosyltransferase
LFVGLLLLFVGVRVARVEADPPRVYPSGRSAQELLVEGPAKANEARRYGLFGTFSRRERDDYRIWSVQSPAYVGPLAGFFRVFGVGMAQLRIFGAIATGAGLVAMYALCRRHPDRRVAPLACLAFAISFHDVMLTRGGLLEPVLNAWLTSTFLCALLALRWLPWSIAATLGFAAALLTKQTAAMAFPALLVLGVTAQVLARRRRESWWQHAVTVGAAVATGAAVAAYVFSPAYWATVEWNYGHMIEGVEKHRPLALGGFHLAEIVARLGDLPRWRDLLFAISPVAAVLAVLQLARTVTSLARRRWPPALELVAAGWFVSAILVLQLTEHVRSRFSVILLPPCVVLAATFVAWLGALLARSRARHVPIVAFAALLLATDGRWLAAFWAAPTYEVFEAGRRLDRVLGPEDVVIGARAPVLAFDTRADTYYVKVPFNTSRAALEGLRVTHLLAGRGDRAARTVKRLFPRAMAKRERVLRVSLDGRRYALYRLRRPLGDAR